MNEYKQGYTDGVNHLRIKLMSEIECVLKQEKNNLKHKPMIETEWANISGWVECLEMIQHTLGVKK